MVTTTERESKKRKDIGAKESVSESRAAARGGENRFFNNYVKSAQCVVPLLLLASGWVEVVMIQQGATQENKRNCVLSSTVRMGTYTSQECLDRIVSCRDTLEKEA